MEFLVHKYFQLETTSTYKYIFHKYIFSKSNFNNKYGQALWFVLRVHSEMNTFISPKTAERQTERQTEKKQSTSANYRLTTTQNAQMTIRTEAKPPKT